MADADMQMTKDEAQKDEGKKEPEKKSELEEEEKEEDSSGNDEEEEDDEEDETEPEGTPEELVAEAKKLMKEDDFAGALSKFSWAVQKKEKSLDSSRQYHPDLASYWLDYGNALLIKEENSNELFQFTKGPIEETTLTSKTSSASSSSTSATSSAGTEKSGGSTDGSMEDSKDEEKEEGVEQEEHVADATITDEQLAWENLEMARMCFANKLEDQSKEGKVNQEDVVDASFVSIRLGDMLTLQEKFGEAAKEYEAAISLRKEHNLPYTRLQAPTLSLAQAQLFAGELQAALENFKIALKLLEDNLAGVDGHSVPQEKKSDFEETVEDLKIQIKETEKAIADAAKGDEVSASPTKGKDGKLRILPENASATTSAFDAPQLGGEVFSVDVGQPNEKPTLAGSPEAASKKRRIDLSEVNARMAASQQHESSSS